MNFDNEIKSFEELAERMRKQNNVKANNQAHGISSVVKMVNEQFPNGLCSWRETYYEMIESIIHLDNQGHPFVEKIMEEQGRGGLWELANKWTCEFEVLNKEREWDGEFFDEMEIFINQKLT